MTRDTCRLSNCQNEPGEQGHGDYRSSQFCSVQHDVKFEHLRDDAKDARLSVGEGSA